MHRRDFLKRSAGVLPCLLPGARRIAARDTDWKGFEIGILSDEVDIDFERALRWIRDQGMRWVEPRNLWGTYVTDLGPAEVRRAQDLLRRYSVKVSAVATAYLKVTLPGTDPVPNEQMLSPFGNYPLEQQEALLLRAFDTARAFGTDKIRIFSYWRVSEPSAIFERVRAQLARAAETAAKANMTLLLENEHACNVATGSELAAMLGGIPSKHLAGLWDPGNCYVAGETPYPDGYRKLDPAKIRHMHLKDAVRDEAAGRRSWKPIGGGAIDIAGQLRALRRDGYRGVISMETHYVPEGGTPADGSLESVRGLRKILASL